MDNTCKIKLGSVNNLTDARFGAAAGAEWIGFSFDTANPLYISPVQAEAIIGWLSGPQPVAEFAATQSLGEIEDIIRLLGFDWIQLAEPAMLHYFEGSDIQVILELDATAKDFEQYLQSPSNAVKAFLIKKCSIGKMTEIKEKYPFVLFDVEGLTQNDLEQLKQRTPYGINISGGFETAPGIRDFDEMYAVFDVFGQE